ASTRNGQSTSLVTAPVDEYRSGDMRRNVDSSGRTIPLYDPFDASGNIIPNAANRPRMQCNGVLDVICPERIDPTAKLLMSLLPHPDDPTKIVNNYRSRSYSQGRTTLPSIKLDYTFTDKHRISYLYSHFFSPAFPSINNLEGLPGTGFPSEVLIEYRKGQEGRLDYSGAYGTVSYSAGGTGNPNVANSGSDWASFLLGVASGGGFRFPSDTTFFWAYYAWFIQDDWMVSRRLTLNIGLRYELPVPKEERHQHNSNFCPTCSNAAAGGLPGAMVIPGVNGAAERVGET